MKLQEVVKELREYIKNRRIKQQIKDIDSLFNIKILNGELFVMFGTTVIALMNNTSTVPDIMRIIEKYKDLQIKYINKENNTNENL